MSVMLFILLLPISSYVAALPFIEEEWRISNTMAGVVFSSSLVGYAVSALFIIPLTDRFGARSVLTASAAVSVAAHVAFPLLARGLAVGLLLRLVSGAGFLGVYVPGLRVVAERFAGGGRGTAMGIFVTAQYMANSVSLAITGALMSGMEWRAAYLVVAAAAGVGLALAFVLLRGQREPERGSSSGRLNAAVLKNPVVRFLILGYSVHAFVLFAVRVWLPLFLAAILIERGEGVEDAAATGATVAGLALVLGSAGPIMGGLLSDRVGRAASASAILGVSAVCSFAIGWTTDLPWGAVVAVSVVYGWATAADSPIYQTGVTEASEAEHIGSTLAMQAFIGLLGGVSGPVVFGGILDLSPDTMRWGIGFSSLGALAIIAIAGLLRSRSVGESRPRARGGI